MKCEYISDSSVVIVMNKNSSSQKLFSIHVKQMEEFFFWSMCIKYWISEWWFSIIRASIILCWWILYIWFRVYLPFVHVFTLINNMSILQFHTYAFGFPLAIWKLIEVDILHGTSDEGRIYSRMKSWFQKSIGTFNRGWCWMNVYYYYTYSHLVESFIVRDRIKLYRKKWIFYCLVHPNLNSSNFFPLKKSVTG